MDLSLETLKTQIIYLNPVAIKVYQYILAEARSNLICSKDSNSNSIITLPELLKIIEKNYRKFENSDLYQDFIPIFHHTIQLTDLSNATNTIISFFNKLYESMQQNGDDMIVILQFVQQFLNSLSAENDDVRKILNEKKLKVINIYSDQKTVRLQSLICIEILVNKFQQFEILDEIWSERLTNPYFDEIFSHLINVYMIHKQIYIEKEFWILSLIYLHKNRKFSIYWLHKAIETITSKDNSLLEFEIPKYFKWTPENLELINRSWLTYLTILENLEGKQSHLILPSLLMLEKIELPCLWKEFLICDMLKHTNTLVLKWSVNYVLLNFTSADFIGYSIFLKKFIKNNPYNDALEIIVKGFNNTFLYSKQNHIKSERFQTFINGSFNRFFKIFINIDWKSIPMHVIMKALKYSISKEIKIITNELLLKLAAKIRRIENKSIRLNIREIYFNIFEKSIVHINLNDFFKLLDTIFNHNEILSEHEKLEISNHILKRNTNDFAVISVELLKILFNCQFDYNMNLKIFRIFLNKNNNYESMLKCLTVDSELKEILITILEEKFENLNELNTDGQEFIKIFINLYKEYTYSIDYDYSKEINLIKNDFNRISKGNIINFSKLKEYFVDRLLQLDFPEKNQFIIDNVSMCLDKGGHNTLYYILDVFKLKLSKCNEKERDTIKLNPEILNRIILEIKNNIKIFGYEIMSDTVNVLIDYITNLPPDELYENITKLLDMDPTNIKLYFYIFERLCFEKPYPVEDEFGSQRFCFQRTYSILKEFYNSENCIKFLSKGLLFGEPLLGEQRIEYDYVIENNLKMDKTAIDVRLTSLKLLEIIKFFYRDINCPYNIKDFRDYLLTESEKLNNKKSRYFKDSKQHRLKLRIIQNLAIISRMEYGWDDRFLIPILQENNQNDVTCIAQLIIASRMENESQIINLLENASEYSHSALVSIFIIAFLFCRRKIDNLNNKELAKNIINLILPWTLGQNFNVRLQAQITIYHIIETCELKNDFQYLFNAISESFNQGNPIENLKKLNDFRYSKKFQSEEYLEYYIIFTLIPKLMNLALDEWFIDFSVENYYQPLKCKIKDDYLRKYYDECVNDEETDIMEEILQIENIQRKINPIVLNDNNDTGVFYCDHKEENKDCDMIVIATLVDKLPNLGGIARTCEVLGIKNLYLSSLKYTETKEFKGLSMTAEKWLNLNELKIQNIQEFLMRKKLDGYKIVGAEQTSNSISFIDFKFPKKSILLLGHEKEGIPANLIAFVDYIVEIPQFGMVRSLNVHVTAALFLWEYCKQHLSN